MPRRSGAGAGREVERVHVVVVGCGRVGSGLAVALEQTGHTVAVIDRKTTAFARLPEDFAGRAIVGVGFDRDRLIEAGIEEASAVAAVTNGDNSNITVARVAKETFGVERVVARIYDPRRAEIYERLGIPSIATVQWTTERVMRRILPDTPAVEWTDPSAKVVLVERRLPPAWAGRKLGDLDQDGVARVVGLSRLGVSRLGDAKTVLQDGDIVYAAVAVDQLDAYEAVVAGGPAH
jgi:trk system potassium uptake protein TrkA